MKTIKLTLLALAVSSASGYALANGLAINEQSVSGMGTSFAGRSSSAQDASTIYGNPAGMSRLGREVSLGGAYIHAKIDIKDASGRYANGQAVQGSNDGDMVPNSVVPFGYFVTPVDDRLHFGLGVYVPYALISNYEHAFQGRYQGQASKVEVITIQPTVSYKITDKVSIGFGPTINRIEGKLNSNVNFGSTQDGQVKIDGDDTAYGFNVGLLADLTDDLTFGLTYHSKVTYKLKGNTEVTGANSQASPITNALVSRLNGKYDASLNITLPESTDASFTYRLNNDWTMYAGATWTRWSRLKSIDVENEGTPTLPVLGSPLATVSEELHWKDTWSYAIGAAYQLNPQWVLRAGMAIDPTPADNGDRNVRIPVGDRKTFSVGAGWSPTKDMTIDVAYAYLWEDDVSVNRPATSTKAGYSAKYDNSAHGLGAQLTYRF
ncbi:MULTISPECIES: OmpP1/FadL family transporter [Pseudomonas]|uniref:OmpP1/FadL family transporter n=1 Tax=Pseudomonas TaxID=286 RepID=UPI0002DCE256|nr:MULTISPECIES: outer membrane protein transport protein [Pseudomonas]MBA1179347.1 transporter [Pseudomonas psychrotolerans]MBA1210439.1 transporter [Pseudomonas psychrotolerans]TCQ90914.1 long-chain fatty acid transport protein [Pseudomonas sp. JUb52]HCV78052.1 Long-chain fatty acid transport protein [Pseudomonas sp.]